MVVVDADHPDIETYIDWKVKEEQKVAALVTGSKINQKHLKAVLKACVNCEGSGDDCFDPEKNPALRREIKLARRALVSDNVIKRSSSSPSRATRTSTSRPTTPTGIGGLPHGIRPELQQLGLAEGRFPRRRNRRRLESDRPHQQEGDQDAEGARALGKIGHAAWASADPGLHFNTTMNDWHTCRRPATSARRTRARNTCSWTTRRATSPPPT